MSDYIYHSLVVDDRGRKTAYRNSNGYRTKSDNTYRVYKSPYYDPKERHERYLREKESGKIQTKSSYAPSSGSKRSGGSGRSGKSDSARGGSRSGSLAVANAVNKLVEESSLNTDAQREAARRKIEDLQNQLRDRIEELKKQAYDSNQTEKNSAERRGLVQNLRNEIMNLQNKTAEEAKRISTNLKNWIEQEQESLARRIAILQGTKYDPNAKKVKEQQQKKRDKEVNSRADAIYKSKTKSKK